MPIVGCVTRLTHQKGIHLIKHAAWRTMERGGQFVLLGSAPDPKVQVRWCGGVACLSELMRSAAERALSECHNLGPGALTYDRQCRMHFVQRAFVVCSPHVLHMPS